MAGCCSIPGYGLAMVASGIPLVFIPTVLRVKVVQLHHIIVAIGLCQHRSGCNGEILAVALYNTVIGNIAIGLKTVSIDNKMLRCNTQLLYGAVHSKNRGIEDIDAVYLLRLYPSNGPCYGITLNNRTQGLALLLAQLLRIIEQRMFVPDRQYHGSGIHSPRQTTAAGFIATCF